MHVCYCLSVCMYIIRIYLYIYSYTYIYIHTHIYIYIGHLLCLPIRSLDVSVEASHPPLRAPLCAAMRRHQAGGGEGEQLNSYPKSNIELHAILIELDDGKICRKALYLMVKTMVSCRFSLKPTQWYSWGPLTWANIYLRSTNMSKNIPEVP